MQSTLKPSLGCNIVESRKHEATPTKLNALRYFILSEINNIENKRVKPLSLSSNDDKRMH